jgi:hypothetical protein
MCKTLNIQPQNVTLLDLVLTELSGGGEMFTAWDITSRAKKQGATQFHRDMKDFVHEKFDDGSLGVLDYTRTLVPTPTGDAWLYHKVGADIQPYIDHINSQPAPSVPPFGFDPAQYAAQTPAATAATQASMTAVAAAPVTVASMTAVQPSQKRQAIDSDGRLPVYADTLGEIGAKPLGTVMVFTQPGVGLYIQNPDNTGTKPNHVYTVNKDGRVRLNPSVLADFKSPTGTYTVAVENGKVVVKAA